MNELVVLLAVIVGYILGKGKLPDLTEARATISKAIKKPTPSAIIHRPTVGQLKNWNKPEVKKQEDEAWHETMEKIPEIKEWRKKQLPGDEVS